MSVEATLRDAFRQAESWRKKVEGDRFKPRPMPVEKAKAGGTKWTGPKQYKAGPLMLAPWQYVDLLHYMAARNFRRGLVSFVLHLIDEHVPKVAARPADAGIPWGTSREERRKIIEMRLASGEHWEMPSPRRYKPREDDKPTSSVPVGALRTKRIPRGFTQAAARRRTRDRPLAGPIRVRLAAR